MSNRKALLFGLGAVLLWSTVATAFNLSLKFVSPLQLVTLASLASWLLLGALLLWSGQLPQLFQLARPEVYRLLILGLINPALYYFLLFGAYARLPAQEAMAINYTWGLVLPLLAAPLLKQPLLPRDMMAALLSYTGVFVIATRGAVLDFRLSDPAGVTLAMASTVIWALYWIGNTRSTTAPLLGLFVGFSAASVVLVAFTLAVGGFAGLTWQGLAGGLYVGLFEMGLSFILWLKAMRLTDNTARLATLIFLSPPLSLLLIWGFLGEHILPSTLVGLALILGGLAVQHLKPEKTASV